MITQAQSLSKVKSVSYINLTTFRKSGAAVATPLWFAEHQGVLYAQTFPMAGKLKRIRHTARVTIAPCTFSGKPTGPQIEGHARIITGEHEIELAEAALAKKYGLTRRIYFGALGAFRRLQRQAPAGRAYIAIEPAPSAQHSIYSQTPSFAKHVAGNHISVVPLFFNW